ncbi:S24 family peptidase [Cereibacter sphaeroides]|nr:S24 family peptidase [Cereibacter sphaeroides]
MEKPFKDALEFAVETTRRSLRSIALDAGVSYEQLKGLMQGKSRSTNFDDGVKVAAVFGVSVEDFLAGNLTHTGPAIAVAGRVGAGAQVDLVDAYEKGDGLYRVAVPVGVSPRGIVAVEVEGESMAPIYQPGEILFYSRDTVGVPTEAIGRICVCEDDTCKAWVKVVRVGREEGTFSLISLNPEAENMHGVRLKWAAPVKFNLPPEYVQRVG